MQSLANLRALAFVERDLLEDRAVRFVHSRAAADGAKLKAILSETAVMTIPGDPTLAPCFRPHVGLTAILQFVTNFHIEYQVLDLHVVDVMVDGDRAVVRSKSKLRHRGTGRSRPFAMCDIVRFENGYIADVCTYADTLAMSEAKDCG
jgi:ketosteroid isomerase-like protein